METFREAWTREVWPVVKPIYQELLAERPAKQETATGVHYGDKVLTAAASKGEYRNVTCNLAWTGPANNTELQADISYDAVRAWCLDFYTDTTVQTDTAASANQQEVAASAMQEGVDVSADEQAALLVAETAKRSRSELLLGKPKKTFRIPSMVPRGYNIPIAIHSKDVKPELGKFVRLGLDIAVNGTWLALKWALDEKNEDAVQKLKNLIKDWPFDFVYFEGDVDVRAEAMLKWMINMPVQAERLRDFVGLGGNNLIRIVAQVRGLLTRKSTGKKQAAPQEVHTWLLHPGNVNWGLFHVPSLRTVTELLRNWDTICANPTVSAIMDKALHVFGRDNLFDMPSKVGKLINKSPDAASLKYLCEYLYAHMLRKNCKDPFSAAELESKHGMVAVILWLRRYIVQVTTQFPEMFQPPTAASAEQKEALRKVLDPAREMLLKPLVLHEKLNGPNRDPTYINSMPSEALKMFYTHIQEVNALVFLPEIKGALHGPNGARWNWSQFHECDRVKKRFAEGFRLAYSKLVAVGGSTGEEGDEADHASSAAAASAEQAGPAAVAGAGRTAADSQLQLPAFRKDCEDYVNRELEARTVILTNDGNHDELGNALTSSRMYQNLASLGARFMGFYDIKNAGLCNIFEGEALTQREPLLDETKFKGFVTLMNSVMKDNSDLCWVMLGKAEQNFDKVMKEIRQVGWKTKVFTLIYDTRLLQKWYWTRMRGIANSKNLEKLVLCWKGKVPPGLPKERRYIDAGSRLYNEVVLKVPVVAPKDLAFVDKSVREQSLTTMAGIADTPADPLPDSGDAPPAANSAASAGAVAEPVDLVKHIKKRKLYRQATGTEVPWFPHDNAPELLKECVWEAGLDDVRWVLHGTPAGGAGVAGVLETGVSVVCLCEDTHHKTHFLQFLRERCVEALLTGSNVFDNKSLRDRASDLLPQGAPKAAEKNKEKSKKTKDAEEKKNDGKDGENQDSKAEEKDTKKKTKEKKKKRKHGSTSSHSSGSSSSSESDQKKKKKKSE